MVELVGHALLLRGVCLDVDNISDMIWNEEGRNFDVAMFYASQISSCTGKHRWNAHL